jgi:carotenoid cleavage dioxygenase-like enzyme
LDRFPPDNAGPPSTLTKRNKLVSDTYRWIFDPKTPTNTYVEPAQIFGINGEFSRIDDRLVTKPYNHFWQLQIEPHRAYDFEKCGSPAGGLFNVIGHFTWDGKTKDVWWAGPTTTFQEPAFIPKSGTEKEGEGYLIALLNHLDVLRNDILIFDALEVGKGPISVVHLPFKVRLGLHGNFVEQRDIEEWEGRRVEGGDVGPVRGAERPLKWQVDMEGVPVSDRFRME